MTGVDIELARAAVVVGLVIAAMLYNLTRLASGGIITGPYLALMILSEQWLNIAGWVVLSVLGVLAIQWAARTWPLPRSWLFAIGVLVPATVHVVLMWLAGAPMLEDLSPFLAAGLYITNGLTAYDAMRQGAVRTFAAATGVALVTLLVIVPVQWGLDQVRQSPPILSAPTLEEPLLVLASLATALAVRVALGWGTAGIIGALFFVSLLNPTSAVVVVVMAVVGTVIYRYVSRYVGLTPKQSLYSIMIVASIAAWFGLFWADWLGIPGAEIAQQYAVEPLLVTGLIISETVRRGPVRMVAGSAVVISVTLVAQWLLETHPRGGLFVVLGVLAFVAALVGYASTGVRSQWLRVLYESERFGPGGTHDEHFPQGRAPWPSDALDQSVLRDQVFRPGMRRVFYATSVVLILVAAVGYSWERPNRVVSQEPGLIAVSTSDLEALADLRPQLERADTVRIVGYPLDPRYNQPQAYSRPLAAQVETYLKRLAGDRASEIRWLLSPDATTPVSWILTPKTVVEVFID